MCTILGLPKWHHAVYTSRPHELWFVVTDSIPFFCLLISPSSFAQLSEWILIQQEIFLPLLAGITEPEYVSGFPAPFCVICHLLPCPRVVQLHIKQYTTNTYCIHHQASTVLSTFLHPCNTYWDFYCMHCMGLCKLQSTCTCNSLVVFSISLISSTLLLK